MECYGTGIVRGGAPENKTKKRRMACAYRAHGIKETTLIENMDWKDIQRIDKCIQETEEYLLMNTPWDGIKDWNFYQEVERRMNKNGIDHDPGKH